VILVTNHYVNLLVIYTYITRKFNIMIWLKCLKIKVTKVIIKGNSTFIFYIIEVTPNLFIVKSICNHFILSFFYLSKR